MQLLDTIAIFSYLFMVRTIIKISLLIIMLPLVVAGAKIATIGKKVDFLSLEPYLFQSDGPIQMHYLGTSCFLFTFKGRTLLVDPFFSNPDFLQLGTGRYKDQSHLIKGILQQKDSISMVAITHGHYDHCLDLPAFSRHFAQNTVLVGDGSIYHSLQPYFRKNKDIHDIIHPDMGSGTWIYSLDSLFRIMPVQSIHNDHFWKIKLFGGSYEKPLDSLPGPVWQWKEGNTYSFVIDFLEGNDIKRRIYLGAGRLPETSRLQLVELGKERPFDLLIPAWWHHRRSGNTLEVLLKDIPHDRVLLHHWNNFFHQQDAGIQSIRSSRLERSLQQFRREGRKVFVMLPFTRAGI